MSKRQASIAAFLSPRQSKSPKASLKRSTLQTGTSGFEIRSLTPTKRIKLDDGDHVDRVKREDTSNSEVELLGEVKADKGKGRATEGDFDDHPKPGGVSHGVEPETSLSSGRISPNVSQKGPAKAAHPFFGSGVQREEKAPSDEPGPSSSSDMTPQASSSKKSSRTTPSFEPFTFPPADHPSYRLPPTPSYNHPFPIARPPSSLIDALSFNTVPRTITSPADLDLLYFTRFIDPCCARQLTKYLLDEMPWYRVNYTTKGIDIKTPRYTTVFGKDSTAMPWEVYGKWRPRAIPEILLRLMQKVEEVTGETYNFTLVNYYASGTDSISYHSDSERFLGPNPCIASISLGAPRDFMLRHVDYRTNGLPVQKFNLHDGDMVVMRGKTQHRWQHSIPKRAKADGRINITFRKGVVQYATENYLTYNVGTGPMFRWVGGKMVEQKGIVG